MRGTQAALILTGLALLAGCGGGERQDEDEPEGDFEVEVTRASFPKKQSLAQSSNLVITVRNAGEVAIPNVAVTVNGFEFRKDDEALADNERPQFVVNGLPREIGGLADAKDATPLGCDTAYVNTWACGRLKPGDEKSFRWSVTAVKAGPYRISYLVAAGLSGNARAVGVGRRRGPARHLHGHGFQCAPRGPDRRRRPDRRRGFALAGLGASPNRHNAPPAGADTWGSAHRSWSARTSRRCCRACCGSASGGYTNRRGRPSSL